MYVDKKNRNSIEGYLFLAELLLAVWGFYILYDSLFGESYLFGVFNLKVSFILISVIFLFAGEIYLYFYFSKRKTYRYLTKKLKHYKELLSESSELKCVKCSDKTEIETSTFSWKSSKGALNLAKVYFNKNKKILIPLCQNCSLSFGYWRKTVSRKKIIQIIAGILFLLSIFFFFSTMPYISIFPLVIGFVLLAVSTRMLNEVKINPNSYIKNDYKHGIIVKPENAPKWFRYDDWIRSSALKENVEEAKVEGQFICKYCNAKLEEAAIFCTECGKSLKD